MYARFSEVYDQLMDDFDYPKWADYYIRLIRSAGVEPKAMIDAACGTGSMTLAFARRGIFVTGADRSEEMLMVAAQKARAAGFFIPWVSQDMRRLTAHKPVDAVVAACDGVNYLLDDESLRAFFGAAYRALLPGGVLAFDFSSQYKLETVMNDQFFGEEREGLAYLWQNRFDRQKQLIHMDLTFFIQKEGNLYERFSEQQTQRAHTVKELNERLLESGFSAIRAYGDQTDATPGPDELRIHMTAVKPIEKIQE